MLDVGTSDSVSHKTRRKLLVISSHDDSHAHADRHECGHHMRLRCFVDDHHIKFAGTLCTETTNKVVLPAADQGSKHNTGISESSIFWVHVIIILSQLFASLPPES